MIKSKSINLWVIIKVKDGSIYKDWTGRVYIYESEEQAQRVIDSHYIFFDKKFRAKKFRLSSEDFIGPLNFVKGSTNIKSESQF